MLRSILSAFLVLAFVVSCSKPKKENADGDVNPTPGAPTESAVEDRPIQMDSAGSDSGKIDGLSTVFFLYDQSTLTGEAQGKLKQNAAWMKTNSKVTVQVEGHCDDRGSIEYNLSLGERRARTVKNYLVGLGIDANRLTIISYGEEKPLVPGGDESAWTKNRRANFVPLGM